MPKHCFVHCIVKLESLSVNALHREHKLHSPDKKRLPPPLSQTKKTIDKSYSYEIQADWTEIYSNAKHFIMSQIKTFLTYDESCIKN